jgi:hypothetical protein
VGREETRSHSSLALAVLAALSDLPVSLDDSIAEVLGARLFDDEVEQAWNALSTATDERLETVVGPLGAVGRAAAKADEAAAAAAEQEAPPNETEKSRQMELAAAVPSRLASLVAASSRGGRRVVAETTMRALLSLGSAEARSASEGVLEHIAPTRDSELALALLQAAVFRRYDHKPKWLAAVEEGQHLPLEPLQARLASLIKSVWAPPEDAERDDASFGTLVDEVGRLAQPYGLTLPTIADAFRERCVSGLESEDDVALREVDYDLLARAASRG